MDIIDEYSSDSTVSYLSDSSVLFDEEDFYLIKKPDELIPKFTSIISTLNLGCNLNLKAISQKIKTISEYCNNNIDTKLMLKLKENHNSIATIYPNGKMICSSCAKSEKEAKSNCMKFAKIIKKAGFLINLKEFKIQNISGNYDINFKMNLNKLYKEFNSLYNNCKFDKNSFPGILLYINDINLTFFENGIILFSGAKNKKDIENIFKTIYPLLIEAKT